MRLGGLAALHCGWPSNRCLAHWDLLDPDRHHASATHMQSRPDGELGGIACPDHLLQGWVLSCADVQGVPLRVGPSRQPLKSRSPLLCEGGPRPCRAQPRCPAQALTRFLVHAAKPRGVYSTPAKPAVTAPQQHKAWGVEALGPDLWNTTYYPKGDHAKSETKEWYVIDAAGQTLGRLATLAADHIRCGEATACALLISAAAAGRHTAPGLQGQAETHLHAQRGHGLVCCGHQR